mgnify:CR=1 FL=1
MATSDSSWAEDAKGNKVKASYPVKSDVIKQTIDFNSETAFPVVVALASHPDITRYRGKITKSQAISIRSELRKQQTAYDIISVIVGGTYFYIRSGFNYDVAENARTNR